MNARPIIAVDAMGGDFGPSVVVPGAIDAARLHDLHVLLVGDTPKVEAELAKLDLANVHFDIVQADDVVHMNEKPSDILRRKKNASIQVACRLVKDGKADAVVSAGHSGATVACGMFIMGRLPGVERPALAALLPTEKNPVVVLDAGANVDCRPYHLFQFGLMGDAFARDLLGYAAPRVSLLSIGEEEGKGNSQVKEAYELLKLAQNLNFVGNAEGRDIFTGDIDVVVCDGFVGNVVVKMSEGLASALVRMLKRLFTSGFLPALGGMLAKGAFKKFATTIDYAEYGGAPLLGLQGLAIVCHGRSSARAMQNALRDAGLAPEAIGHINAHATSTQLNDKTETKGIKLVFGEHASKIKISATKSMTGHLLGAAGGVESVFTAMALHTGWLPGTINLENPDPNCDLDYMAGGSAHIPCEYAMCNSFGFGGTNASLILKKWND